MSISSEDKKKSYRSVSQYNQYKKCPYSYKLARIDKVWQRPASWLSQGIAVHACLEAWEKSGRTMSMGELKDLYNTEYANSINQQAKVTPNFEYWFGSGPYNGEVDIERRYVLGWEQVEGLIDYLEDSGDSIWITPDNKPAVELRFDVELGGVPVVGYIDQIIVDKNNNIKVRDLKTGAKPGDVFQLTVYAEAMRQAYGVEIESGDYLMGKTCKPTRNIVLSKEERYHGVHKAFKELEENINNNDFPPIASKANCAMCSVKTSCEYAKG